MIFRRILFPFLFCHPTATCDGRTAVITKLSDEPPKCSSSSSSFYINNNSRSSVPAINGAQSKKTISLQRTADKLCECFTSLGKTITDDEVESLSVLIVESMSTPGRVFHGVGHIFDISTGAGALTTLSGLFHDVVYYNVDGGISAKQADILKGVITEEEGGVVKLNPVDSGKDELLAMVVDIFGFSPSGQTLSPFAGQNEFLSAVIAARVLQQILSLSDLAQIVACIEATIPFRKITQDGETPADILHRRLITANYEYQLGMTSTEIIETVHHSVDLANRDVGNFASPNTAYFLEQTWKLIPEANVPIRQRSTFTVTDYYNALYKQEKFFGFLDSNVVFRSFQNKPDKLTGQVMVHQAAHNIEIGWRYIRAKLLSLAVLVAMLKLSGGDVPYSLFMDGDKGRLDAYFPPVEVDNDTKATTFDPKVYKLLRKGREADSTFDYRDSPMAAYLYRRIGAHGVNQSLEHVTLPMDNESSRQLLRSLPRDVVANIAHHAAMFIGKMRGEQLLNIVEDLY